MFIIARISLECASIVNRKLNMFDALLVVLIFRKGEGKWEGRWVGGIERGEENVKQRR